MTESLNKPVRLILCGDVMTGRGIDQILPCPGDPTLYEPYVRNARVYVRLAEALNGPIPRPVDPRYVWGDALAEFRRADVDARIVNLETSITCDGTPWPGKGIHYRMHPANIECLTAAGIDCCCLANNHVLDWGREGLTRTLRSLEQIGIPYAGAGDDEATAAAPAVLRAHGGSRVLVFSVGATSSGIPRAWAAGPGRPGVHLLKDLSEHTAGQIAAQVRAARRPGDVTVVSIHWGGNWGDAISAEEAAFAHRLVDGGVDIVHGHSSHHVKGIEVYRDRLILYGCGDFVNDYEGIGGHEEYRSDLRLMYVVEVDPRESRLVATRLVPVQVHQMRLRRASSKDVRWLRDRLNSLGTRLGTAVALDDSDQL